MAENRLPKNIIDYLKLFREIGIQIIGEELLDCYTKTVNTELWVIMKFPDYNIRNRDNDFHTIKELYIIISLYIENNRLCIRDIRGFRGKITVTEWYGDYWHSHLRWSKGGSEPRSFCLGGSEISMLKSRINDSLHRNCETEALRHEVTSLYLHMDTLAKWESLEGGPHRRIKNLRSVTNTRLEVRNIAISGEELANFYGLVREEHIMLMGNASIKISPQLEEQVLMANPRWISYKDSEGHTFSGIGVPDMSTIQQHNDHARDEFVFKGEPVKTKIDLSEVMNTDLNQFQKVINPYIIQKLNTELNNVSRGINLKKQITHIRNAWKDKAGITV